MKGKDLRVLVLTRYARLGASSRIRHFDLIPALQQEGFICRVDALLNDEDVARFFSSRPRSRTRVAVAYLRRFLRLTFPARHYDLIWIEKEVFPWMPWILEKLAYARAGCATVVDFDDNWVARYEESHFRVVRHFGKAKFRRLLQKADMVTVANPMLTKMIAEFGNRDVTVIYNAIDLDRYARAARLAHTHATGQLKQPLQIGWIGTPYTAGRYLGEVVDLLNRLQSEGLVSLTLIGAGSSIPHLTARRLPWREDSEAEDLAALDVGIMPLSGTEFDNGKSGWKLVQYMAAGLPVVAQAVGFNTMLVENGINGFLVSNNAEFEARLRLLAENPALCRKMGEAAQRSLEDRYGLDRTARQTVAVLRAAVDHASRR